MKQICVISLARIISKTVKIYKYKISVSCLDYINHMFQCRKLHNLIILILEDNMRFCRFCMYWQCNCQCSLHKLIDLETVHAMLKKWVSKPYLKTLHSVTTFFPILLHTQESPFKFLCQMVWSQRYSTPRFSLLNLGTYFTGLLNGLPTRQVRSIYTNSSRKHIC